MPTIGDWHSAMVWRSGFCMGYESRRPLGDPRCWICGFAQPKFLFFFKNIFKIYFRLYLGRISVASSCTCREDGGIDRISIACEGLPELLMNMNDGARWFINVNFAVANFGKRKIETKLNFIESSSDSLSDSLLNES